MLDPHPNLPDLENPDTVVLLEVELPPRLPVDGALQRNPLLKRLPCWTAPSWCA